MMMTGSPGGGAGRAVGNRDGGRRVTETIETYCPVCDAEAFPAEYGGPGGGAHYTVRNHDHWLMTPYLDGERLTRCEECLAGTGGWTVEYADPPLRCPECALETLRTIRRGSVTVANERRIRELADDIRLVLIPRVVALVNAAERAGDRERLKRIQTSLVTRIGKETAGE